MNLDPNVVRQQINNLLLQYPELAEDDVLRADMVEGSTDAHEFLSQVALKVKEASAFAGAQASIIADLELRQARYVRREQAMRELAERVMSTAVLTKVELPIATLYFQKGRQKLLGDPEITYTDNPAVKASYSWDRAKIKEAIENGLECPGFSLSNAAPVLCMKFK